MVKPDFHPRVFSRRNFLMQSGAGAATLLAPEWLRALQSTSPAQDPRLADVLAKTIAIDMHNHVYPNGTEPHPQQGPGPQGPPAGAAKQGPPQGRPPGMPQGRMPDLPALPLADELKRSGLTAVCAAITIDFVPTSKPGEVHDYFLHWLDAIDRELDKAQVHRALTLHDLEEAHSTKKPTIVQSTEGAHFMEGHPDRLEEVYKRGLRHMQPLHDRDDKVAPLGDVITQPARFNGLTPLGIDVIKECNRLGMLVDMAHASAKTVEDTLKVAKHPILVSHTNLDTWTGKDLHMAEMMKAHLISKQNAKVVADAGGVVGVWTHLTDSPAEFVGSIKAMVDAIGVDHVGIGTDTDLLNARNGTNHAWPSLMGNFFPVVAGEMLQHGFTPGEITRIGGGNYCRLFEAATAGH